MIIKVSSIFNLTDVRFFASQDVDFIGLNFSPEKEGQVSAALAKELMGWIHGPKIVAECTGMDKLSVEDIISELQPEAVEADVVVSGPPVYFHRIAVSAGSVPMAIPDANFLVVEVTKQDLDETDVQDFLEKTIENQQVILAGLQGEELIKAASDLKPAGVEIMGSAEIATGLKDFSEVYDLLEKIRES